MDKTKINEELQAKILQFERLTEDLGVVATGIDGAGYDGDSNLSADLSREFQDFLRPIVRQLKELTAKPREIEDLRSRASHRRNQIKLANQAIGRIDLLLASANDETVTETLRALRTLWGERLREAESSLRVSEVQLDEAGKDQSSVFVSAWESVGSFFRSRGRNFLTAVFAFFGVWFGIRLLHRVLIRRSPWHRKKERSFYVRLTDIVVEVGALLLGIFASVLVLYSAPDWVLLGLLLIFLAGVAWSGRRAVPLLYEQTKLFLNLGSVRERLTKLGA